MLHPQLLKTFLTVAAALSFRKAAQALHCAPSTVTSQIKALEEELGVPLFERSSRRVRLTGHGQGLVPNARRIVDLVAETRRMAAGDEDASAELAVRISESLGVYCLPWVLPRFRSSFPATRLTLSTHSRYGLHQDILHGVMDAALILGEPFSAQGLEVEVLGREKLVVVVGPNSQLAGRHEVQPEDLAGQTLVLTQHVWSVRRLIELAFMEAQVRPVGLIECTSVEMVKACVMAGQGVSVVPAFSVRVQAQCGELATIEWAGRGLSAPVLLARKAHRLFSPAAAAFFDILRVFFSGGERGEH